MALSTLRSHKVIAYVPIGGPERLANARLIVFKTGGRLIRHARYFTLQLAESYLTRPLIRQIVARIEQLTWHPT